MAPTFNTRFPRNPFGPTPQKIPSPSQKGEGTKRLPSHSPVFHVIEVDGEFGESPSRFRIVRSHHFQDRKKNVQGNSGIVAVLRELTLGHRYHIHDIFELIRPLGDPTIGLARTNRLT
jgi:hypothetical protein